MRRFTYFWLYFVAIVASLGGLLSGFDTGVISGALLFINQTWDLSDYLQGFLVSSVLIGAVLLKCSPYFILNKQPKFILIEVLFPQPF